MSEPLTPAMTMMTGDAEAVRQSPGVWVLRRDVHSRGHFMGYEWWSTNDGREFLWMMVTRFTVNFKTESEATVEKMRLILSQ